SAWINFAGQNSNVVTDRVGRVIDALKTVPAFESGPHSRAVVSVTRAHSQFAPIPDSCIAAKSIVIRSTVSASTIVCGREEQRAEARKSRCIGIQQISESIGGNYHRIMPTLDFDRLPACSLNPIAARFQRLVDRIGTDDVGRRQAIADLIRQL